MGDKIPDGKEPVAKDEGDTAPSSGRRVLRVDQLWSRKDRQWHFVKTAKVKHTDRFRKYTLVIRRVISAKGMLARTEVDIKSPKLADLLLKIFNGVEGLKLTNVPPMLEPRMFFHAYQPLVTALQEQEAKKGDADKDLVEDIQAALEFLRQEFTSTVENLESMVKHGDITYDLLWAIFPPKTEIFTEANLLKEPQAMRFASGTYEDTEQGSYYSITGRMISHDGDDFGWSTPALKITYFDGSKKITNLSVYPFSYHNEPEATRALLLARGRKYLTLLEPACRQYQDLAVYGEDTMQGEMEKRFVATGRIMVDPIAFRAQNPNADLLTPWVPESIAITSLSDDDIVTCNHRILGFSFTQKKWGAFAVSRMSDVVWNEAAFDRLILEEKKRRMISMLVRSHRNDDNSFDDIITGKGKGLVGLLSGNPGVGKTLTAEVVAELSRRPLYIVSAGELGTTVSDVDTQLGMVLDITRRWGCVLLIDEADVFLYKRGEAQLERNALVSIFLRRLEYFQGIVILTTNRRRDIDKAFKSRIHFKFHYPPLTEDGRLQIWKNFLESIPDAAGVSELTEADLRTLARQPMNGREIKNAVSCAISIVRASKEPLTVQVIKDILESLVEDWDGEPEDD